MWLSRILRFISVYIEDLTVVMIVIEDLSWTNRNIGIIHGFMVFFYIIIIFIILKGGVVGVIDIY